jgi:4-diphosphocytidyl-2-C-methyl-D-erythritol kinase
MGSGRGELVTPVMTRGEYWWVIVPDDAGLSTPAVYERFDHLHGPAVPEPEVPDRLLAALRAGDPHALGAALTNDLEPAALSFRPDLAALLTGGRVASAHGALVSGSGPTTVFLCESAAHAEVVDLHLQRENGTPPALVVRGPVPGARVTGGQR